MELTIKNIDEIKANYIKKNKLPENTEVKIEDIKIEIEEIERKEKEQKEREEWTRRIVREEINNYHRECLRLKKESEWDDCGLGN
jgi:hypothetical protein